MKFKTIKNLKNLKGKKVLLRVDFNVPMEGDTITDDFRIQKAIPTIQYLKKGGAKIIIIAHLENSKKENPTLLPVAECLNTKIKTTFVPALLGEVVQKKINDMKNGHVIMLENLRKNKSEKENDTAFAKELASFADMYVNDAFSVSHRKQASVVLIPKYLPSYAGLQFEEEVKKLTPVIKKPKHPFLFILGGAKFDTKMPLVKKYLETANHVFIGGALANNFFKAEGFEVGKSIVDDENFHLSKLLKNKKIFLPLDVVAQKGIQVSVKRPHEVLKDEKIMDCGPETVLFLKSVISHSKLVLWNGPLGFYEGGFDKTSSELLKTLAKSKTESIIGGGDTVALVSKLNLEKKLTFVSTGGGATLDFLTYGTLPGIKALERK